MVILQSMSMGERCYWNQKVWLKPDFMNKIKGHAPNFELDLPGVT